ncbi:MAG TPA: hypothetical protein VHC44_02005, partial [Verrucomicrobiae bacterium]|nr:hypothetical protein [Verrucomicrobiae bacterium]
ISQAQQMAATGVAELSELEKDFNSFWPKRNKGATKHCSEFLQWRLADYRKRLPRNDAAASVN